MKFDCDKYGQFELIAENEQDILWIEKFIINLNEQTKHDDIIKKSFDDFVTVTTQYGAKSFIDIVIDEDTNHPWIDNTPVGLIFSPSLDSNEQLVKTNLKEN